MLRIRPPERSVNGDVLALYFILAVGLLAPLASDTILPIGADHGNHTAFIVEAKLALDEGQLPLRVAPFAQNGLRYPLFQFYAQTPYLVAGAIYKYLTPQNPWRALKLSYLAGLCLAGFFVFKVCELLQFDRPISALTGVVYITAPYLLINIHAREAYTEAFARFTRSLSSIISTPEANYNPDIYEFVGDVPSLGLENFRRYPEVQQHCRIKQAAVTCDLDGPAFVQLPMLFYPSLLQVTVNGQAVRYRPSLDGERRLVSVLLEPGKNLVVGRFAGSVVGNAASGVSAALTLVFFFGWALALKFDSRHAI